ncbi:MAG: hypothetical protein GY822_24595 [Deltaproteobacteria bacterium]|nr:hypothetical protein [Deltaproteobacteria bacterium]
MYIADTGNNRIRYVDQPGEPGATMTTLLGDGSPASSGTGPVASRFPVDNPIGMHLDRYGNLFVTSRNAVRVISRATTAWPTKTTALTSSMEEAPAIIIPNRLHGARRGCTHLSTPRIYTFSTNAKASWCG